MFDEADTFLAMCSTLPSPSGEVDEPMADAGEDVPSGGAETRWFSQAVPMESHRLGAERCFGSTPSLMVLLMRGVLLIIMI